MNIQISKPNPRQREFFNATARHIAYGGARGGGKSWAMRNKLVLLAFNYPKLKLLLMRRTLPELRENHIVPLMSTLNGIAKYKDDEKVFIFPNGSRLKLGYCDSEKDVYQYQGQEYDIIGLEEATHFTETMKDFITTCNRTTRTDIKPRMYYTSNPGNVGHAWFKRLFIDRQYRGEENPNDYVFIPAKVYDNEVLINSNPEYLQALKNLPEELRRAHLDGDWNVFSGQYFTEFRNEIHTITPFTPQPYWNKYVSIDYGLDMLAALFIAVDTRNKAYVYKEIYQQGLIVSEACRRIKEADNDIKQYFAPPDLWNRHSDTGKSTADIFLEQGIYLYKSKNSRVDGWMELREWLKPYKDEQERITANLVIMKNCVNLIRTLPQLQFDKNNPNDVATEPHELTHAPDALRGFFAGRPTPTIIKTVDEEPCNEYDSFINYGG